MTNDISSNIVFNFLPPKHYIDNKNIYLWKFYGRERGVTAPPNPQIKQCKFSDSKVFGFLIVKRCDHSPPTENLIRKCIINSSQFWLYVLATRFQFDYTSSNDFKVIFNFRNQITMDDNERKKIKQLMREKG